MKDKSKTIDMVLIDKIVKCPKLSPAALVSVIDTCVECEHYKGTLEVMAAGNGKPAVEDVRCAMPIGRRMEAFVKGAK